MPPILCRRIPNEPRAHAVCGCCRLPSTGQCPWSVCAFGQMFPKRHHSHTRESAQANPAPIRPIILRLQDNGARFSCIVTPMRRIGGRHHRDGRRRGGIGPWRHRWGCRDGGGGAASGPTAAGLSSEGVRPAHQPFPAVRPGPLSVTGASANHPRLRRRFRPVPAGRCTRP